MTTLFWVLLTVYLLGVFAIPLIDAFDNRKNGKIQWFYGHEKKGYWKRCIPICLVSWWNIYRAAKKQLGNW